MSYNHAEKHFNVKPERKMEKNEVFERIATALDRLAPEQSPLPDFNAADAFIWQNNKSLSPVNKVNRVEMKLLKGIDQAKQTLTENTERFAKGYSANNALLWGARGMGKSSLVKAVHHFVAKQNDCSLKLVEIHREDIESLPVLMGFLRPAKKHRFIVFCDDLSFDGDDTSYKSLKAALDGGIEGRPENMLFYATSNRRHLLPRDMMENERSTAINPSETVQEKVSLSDRFGLWLGFHNCNQDQFLEMVESYCSYFELNISKQEWRPLAIEWAVTRGARSGRVAWQFVQDLAGRLGKNI
jgi:predicted AAA+ superfamily ATPase